MNISKIIHPKKKTLYVHQIIKWANQLCSIMYGPAETPTDPGNCHSRVKCQLTLLLQVPTHGNPATVPPNRFLHIYTRWVPESGTLNRLARLAPILSPMPSLQLGPKCKIRNRRPIIVTNAINQIVYRIYIYD